jgi:competence protein ComEC
VAAVLRAQLALSLGMLPLVVLSTGSLPWSGVPANLLAVPAVSLLVVPATLFGGAMTWFWPAGAALAWQLADAVLGGVLQWLDWWSGAPAPAVSKGAVGLLLAQAAAAAWLLQVPRRYLVILGLALILPLTPSERRPPPGHYRVTALDVGQGTAVLVETRRYRLLYDAGPAFPSGFDTGSAVVVPNLLADARPRLDVLVLSHDDLDHTGGASQVLERLSVGRLLSPPSVRRLSSEGVVWNHCNGGGWHWDGVDFRLLALPRPVTAGDNDRSCVLLVDDGRHRTLLAGDLSRRMEPALLRAVGEPVHLMFAPHHGSRTSSSRALVRVLSPALVMVSAAWGNRFGHPHPAVVERYRAVGARLYQTGLMGRLVWRSDRPDRLERWRVERAPYWRGKGP